MKFNKKGSEKLKPLGGEDIVFALFTTPKLRLQRRYVGIPGRENGRPSNLLEIELEMFSSLKTLVLIFLIKLY